MKDQDGVKEEAFLLEEYSDSDVALNHPESEEPSGEIVLPNTESKHSAWRRPFDHMHGAIVLPPTASQETAGRYGSAPQSFYIRSMNVAKSVLVFFIPSFVVARYTDKTLDPPAKIQPTAYLNGLRGIAAFCVWSQHFMTEYYSSKFQWGYQSRPEDVWFLQWPFVRVLHSGLFMVTIFFILSGFVLSLRPLQLAREREDQQLLKSLASSVFRRAPRLFLPIVSPLFVAAICVHYQVFYQGNHSLEGLKMAATGGSLWAELRTAFWSWNIVINPLSQKQSPYFPPTDAPLWTLSFEFEGSIVIFLLVLCFAKIRSSLRLLSFGGISLYCLFHSRWPLASFINGAILAELRLIREEKKIPEEETFKPSTSKSLLKVFMRFFWTIIFIASIYIGSLPVFGAISTPGYMTMVATTPQQYYASAEAMAAYWGGIASVMLLLALENCESLQRPFASAFARYLGDISFSLYVIHVPMLLTMGRPIAVGFIHLTGNYAVGLCLTYTVLVPILVCLSDVQWRLFDENSVKFARWLALKMAA
ncbi:uncharacterized protein RCO7_07682 [Rhynchosporium graminicola]|uniref:Acyltransferase 3 domain-containing protein n=1 Tax=Rhynchosporium graminicola TaxID=2792576 RepID=A0A1E1LPW4_9HELO|nr:uncharacterized protein RCO7_07682 [Rhynchosporium commune]